ncbi:MAG: extracellular solute-binding protein [Gammaproteobacteria bacterium]|nr:extracellular solute-binding protein [Gammaproteobacteria bacterium]MDH5652494.1 extracellular solute-binding protein [Gammaproteobacteria bacterium]
MRLLLLVLSGLLTLACHTVSAEEILVYSGRSDKFVKPVFDAFTRKTGIKVVLHSGSSTALLNKLNLEQRQTKADVFISNDAGNLQKGAELGLFRPVSNKIARNIPSNYRAKDNSWLGLSARARVLVVNTNSPLAREVDSVFDLASPKLKGQLAITHSSNESYIAGVTVYMVSAGKEKTLQWLKGMKDNVDNSVFNKHGKIVKAVADGKKAVGLVNHYYIYRHLDKHPDAPIKLVMPDQIGSDMGVAWNVAGAAIIKHSKKAKAVEKLFEFMTSREGQTLFAEANREYPVRPGISASSTIPSVGSFKVADVPMAELGKQRGATLDLIEKAGMP